MKVKISLPLLAACLFVAGCTGQLVPEKELAAYQVKNVMELGSQNYSTYNYDAALYYYTEVGKIFTNDNDDSQDARAWAKYEIGYIKYMQEKYDEADKYFDEVLSLKLLNTAPQILAREMKDKIREKKK